MGEILFRHRITLPDGSVIRSCVAHLPAILVSIREDVIVGREFFVEENKKSHCNMCKKEESMDQIEKIHAYHAQELSDSYKELTELRICVSRLEAENAQLKTQLSIRQTEIESIGQVLKNLSSMVEGYSTMFKTKEA